MDIKEKIVYELSFDKVPNSGVRTKLKEVGFQWNPTKKVWFAEKNEATEKEIESLKTRD